MIAVRNIILDAMKQTYKNKVSKLELLTPEEKERLTSFLCETVEIAFDGGYDFAKHEKAYENVLNTAELIGQDKEAVLRALRDNLIKEERYEYV